MHKKDLDLSPGLNNGYIICAPEDEMHLDIWDKVQELNPIGIVAR